MIDRPESPKRQMVSFRSTNMVAKCHGTDAEHTRRFQVVTNAFYRKEKHASTTVRTRVLADEEVCNEKRSNRCNHNIFS